MFFEKKRLLNKITELEDKVRTLELNTYLNTEARLFNEFMEAYRHSIDQGIMTREEAHHLCKMMVESRLYGNE